MSNSHLVLAKFVNQNSDVPKEFLKLHQALIQKSVPNYSILTADDTANTTTNLAASNLSLNTSAYTGGYAFKGGNYYVIEVFLYTTTDPVAGFKFDLGGGTATFSPYKIQATFNIAAATANVGTTTLTTAIGDTDAVIGVSFRAFGLCTNAGSVILRSAQNAAGTGATILSGSWIRSFEVPV